jgi:hypothetical protein
MQPLKLAPACLGSRTRDGSHGTREKKPHHNMNILRKIKRSEYYYKTGKIRPPLAVAALYGHVNMVELLLANGADLLWELSEGS